MRVNGLNTKIHKEAHKLHLETIIFNQIPIISSFSNTCFAVHSAYIYTIKIGGESEAK